MARSQLVSQLGKVIRRPGFWFILLILVLLTVPHYADVLQHPSFIKSIMSGLNLGRHAFERILYLAPIIWAGLLFGWKGALITSIAALALMLPRAFLVSEYPRDTFFEIGAVFILGNVVTASFTSLRKEREYRTELEAAHRELSVSEQRYRQLFENAHDAIWLHDLEGNIITTNRAAEMLTSYNSEDLAAMNVRSFLSEESLNLAQQIRKKLLSNEVVQQPYEQHLIRKDGSVAIVQLATSLVFDQGKPVAFQHIARDITEQKRMQENLHYYLHEITRAQEEERKRISHELHDDTIQALVALSRRLDTLASSDKGLSEEYKGRLEELWQETNNIIQGVRRLSQDLRPAALDRLGLLPALEWLAAEVTKFSGILTEVKVLGTERRLPEEVELVLFRITQEAMRNVWRHSQANKAEIEVEFVESAVKITIKDNGKGFQPLTKTDDLVRKGKLGLAGMQERAQLIGGNVTVNSIPGQGSTVAIELPI